MFEHALIISSKQKGPKNRPLIIGITIVIHAVVFAGVLVAQYWTIDAVPEPPIQVSFFQAAAPPPPPPPPAPPKPKAPEPKPVEQPKQVEIVQPLVVPEKVPEPTNEPAEDLGFEGVEGGVEGGVAGGVVGGTLGGVPEGTGDEILHVGGAITKPERMGGQQPAYTELARKARVQGVVIVEAIIDKQGNVTNARILKGLPMGLDESALTAVRGWKFKPATLNGRPVSVYYNLTVNFRLQ